MRRSYCIAFACAAALSVAAHAQVQPGQWESTVTVQSIDMPGAPPQVAAMMKGKTTRQTYCITPEQAAKGPQEMLKQNPSCHFTKYSMTGGVISTAMTCSQNGGTMTAQANGRYGPTSFNVTSTAVMSGRMSMRMTSASSGRRLGPCAGK
ncbi:DUF3617 domain-containing protein [Rhizorhabdus wittichii]|jgi:hypothetical protein|uniref:DUF3617 domain-containing protein n=2 Tax=Rhizorhabdus wittichii TaxID=160791 RepID=A0A9J9HFU1_RHIWR|nr:DUF3617 domain-containing protein [Rhizorhabdus wittichii]ABQ70767.1 hypothetical protein Swit_4429 [Rhizorhabdus wittichii RW1]QTH23730.1 DUF3617 domain-containing protein [Rhizorhabdus wittichii]